MTIRCEEMRELLPAYADGGDASLSLRRHVSHCDGCRAELGRYEQMLNSLGALTATVAEPPPRLLSALQSIPSSETRIDQVRTHVVRNKTAYAGGAALAFAGAAAGAALWRTRRSRLNPA